MTQIHLTVAGVRLSVGSTALFVACGVIAAGLILAVYVGELRASVHRGEASRLAQRMASPTSAHSEPQRVVDRTGAGVSIGK